MVVSYTLLLVMAVIVNGAGVMTPVLIATGVMM
jgi:hypothetical protein